MSGQIIIVMGVSGSGKTTLGKSVATRLGLPFFDADDFHPAANVEKMRGGAPLNDDDREPWLARLAQEIGGWSQSGGAVLACSALKKKYRDTLRGGGAVVFAHVHGSEALLTERINARKDHYMPPSLLRSQLATLEEPKDALKVDLSLSTEEQADSLLAQLRSRARLSVGGAAESISDTELRRLLEGFLDQLGPVRRVLVLPPDHTRGHSRAGDICRMLWEMRGTRWDLWFMPALGTHVPMDEEELRWFFGPDIPLDRFLPHRWRTDLRELGEISASEIRELSDGLLDTSLKAAVNRELFNGYDLVLSVGQVVPHEVIGMANYTKNVMIGVGGSGTIHTSHYLGAVWGMERMMGRIDTPVRRVLNTAFDRYLRGRLPVQFLLTVVSRDAADGTLKLRGLFGGDDDATFAEAARLSQEVNLDLLTKPIKKAVVYLDPLEFKTTWLGNKAVYRTRMAMADDGELLILAPALRQFGEDEAIDTLIRRHGYRGSPAVAAAVADDPEMAGNLSAAAHLIHGSSEGRFRITYAPGPGVTEAEIRGVGYGYESYEQAAKRYDPEKLKDGWQTMPDGEEIFYVSNPALGLWALRDHFSQDA